MHHAGIIVVFVFKMSWPFNGYKNWATVFWDSLTLNNKTVLFDEKFAAYARVSKKEGNLRLVKKIGYHS